MGDPEQSSDGLDVVTATVAAIACKDIAAADRYLAPDCQIRPAALFSVAGEPDAFGSFAERFASMERHCASWSVTLLGVEAIDETRYLVRTKLDIERDGGVGIASLAGAIFECSDGLIHWVLSFDQLADAETTAYHLGHASRLRRREDQEATHKLA